MEDENIPRAEWRLAKFVELVPSKDNLIRVAKIKVQTENILTRPINQLYSLELSNHNKKNHSTGEGDQNNGEKISDNDEK